MAKMVVLGRVAGTMMMIAWTWGKYTFLAAKLLGSLPAQELGLLGAGVGAILGLVLALRFPEKAAIAAIVGLPLPASVESFLRRHVLSLATVLLLLAAVGITRSPIRVVPFC